MNIYGGNKMNCTVINLEEAFAKKLGMRTTAIKLFQDLENETEVILDFKDITFMSRSFAQEYVHQKHISKVYVKECNMSDFIKGLLEVVESDYEETCLS